MAEIWLIEFGKGIGRLFINPLLYWFILLLILAGYQRIKQERIHFGARIFDVFSEWKNTWVLSILLGLFISALTIGIGLVFSFETIMLMSVIVIIISLSLRFSMLSASYTIGITYLLLLFLPFVLDRQSLVDHDMFSTTNFTGLSIIMGLFLIVESQLMSRIKRNETFPTLVLGRRGSWIGQHHIKKLSIIPFFALIPTGLITPFAEYWPYVSLGGESYGIILIPFVIGFDQRVRASLPHEASINIAKSVLLLAILVILLAAGSIYLSWLSLAAVLVAIVGREFINYRHRVIDKEKPPFFLQNENGLKVLGIIPGTPADRLQIYVGEMISKVNGDRIHSSGEFYQALQESGSFFKMEIMDDAGEVRFVQSALYEGDHHELGLIFTRDPYRKK